MSAPFKVVTYNVLADDCIRPEFYPNILPEHLNKRLRYPQLVEKIVDFEADILCLQEVDNTLYASLSRALEPIGYHGFHQLKTGKRDGLATFLREDLPQKFTYEIIRFEGLGLNDKPIAHIATITRLIFEKTVLTVANTHLKWDAPGTPLEKRIGYNHAQQLLKTLGSLSTGPQIVMGDFNAQPANEILTAFELRGYSDAHDASTSTFNAADGGARKIDYMLCTEGIIFNPLPTPIITDNTLLPGDTEPSDHLPLMAEFTLMD